MTKNKKTICVFCSSSNDVSDFIKTEGAAFAKLVAEKGYDLLYGGTAQGLMKVVADSYKAAGGHLIGVIPTYMTDSESLKKRLNSDTASLENMADQGKLYLGLDEVIKVDDLGPRKQIMLDRADAIVCLPGGIGTYDEFFTVLTLKQVGSHNKPIYLLNSDDYFNALIGLINHGVQEKTIKPGNLKLFEVFDTPEELVAKL
ncbi:MAG: TIGR00730 family Rossman fold protein [Candidatus Riflebacteria bacterium]|nr:TIGR00730 family Rossman fold protein [Candidatus Riflebacteria bacterium]